MRSIKYTNFILTVIAVCLLYQCAKFAAEPVTAQTTPKQPVMRVELVGTPSVQIAGANNPLNVNVTNSEAIPIKVPTYQPLEVKVASVNDKVPVEIKNFPSVPVEVTNTVRTQSDR